MALAFGWSTALTLGVPYLDIEGMVRTHGALNLAAVLVLVGVLGTRVAAPALPVVTVRTAAALVAAGIGGVVAFALLVLGGERVAAPVQDLEAILPAAALIGPVIPAWLLAGSRLSPDHHPAWATVILAVSTVVLASIVTAAYLALLRPPSVEQLFVFAACTALGLAVAGWIGLIAAVPCAVVWTWAVRRDDRRRAA